MAYFSSIAEKISPQSYGAKIASITVRIYISDCTGTVYVTDLMLQSGSVATGWVGHPSEIRWSLDG